MHSLNIISDEYVHTHIHTNIYILYTSGVVTRSVSDPPTMLSPRPILSLLISTIVSFPGMISHVAGSAAGSSVVDDRCFPEGEGERRIVEEGEMLGETEIVVVARVEGRDAGVFTVQEPGTSISPTVGVTAGDIECTGLGGGDFCGIIDEISGFGSNPGNITYL